MRCFLAALAALWLAFAPAAALAVPSAWTVYSSGPGTIVQLGSNKTNNQTTVVLTTTNDAPAHTTIIVFGATDSAAFATTWVTDTNGDTFTLSKFTWNTTGNAGVGYKVNTAADLPAGSTITVTSSSSTDKTAIVAIDVPNLNGGGDVVGTQQTGTGTSASVSTGTLASTPELVCGATFTHSLTGTYTEAAGFTSMTQQTADPTIQPGCKTALGTGSVTYAPSWVTSGVFGSNVWSWKSP